MLRCSSFISRFAKESIECKRLLVQASCLFHLSVGQFVRWVNCGKVADWMWMPFGVVSGVGRGMGVLDYRRGKGSSGGKCGASHCNQWGTFLV